MRQLTKCQPWSEVRATRAAVWMGWLAVLCMALTGVGCSSDDEKAGPNVATVDVFDVVACACDDAYVVHLAGAFRLPSAPLVEDDDTFQILDEGRVLTVYKQSSAFEYQDTDRLEDATYVATGTAAAAAAFATSFLAENALLPAQGEVSEIKAVVPKGGDSSRPHHWDVLIGLGVEAGDGGRLRVVGAGITVSVGADELLGVVWHWRNVVRGRAIELREPAIAPEHDSSPVLVYKMDPPAVLQAHLLPYYLDASGHHAELTPASDAIPEVAIEGGEPANDGTVAFTAHVSGGKPPLSYEWQETAALASLGHDASVTVTPGPGLYVRVRVTDATGLTAEVEAPVPYEGAGRIPAFDPNISGSAGPISAKAKLITGKGWSMTADTGGTDGLVITNLKFNQRLVASRISMPSYRLATESLTERSCVLERSSPAGKACGSTILQDTTCWGSGASIGGAACRAKSAPDHPVLAAGWIVNPYRALDPNAMVVQAMYLVDDATPVEDSCTLWVAQTYVFSPSKAACADAPGIGDETVPCARFYPLVSYWLLDADGAFCDGNASPSMSWVNAFEAQYRLDFDMAPDARDFAKYVDASSVGDIFSAMQKTEGSSVLLDYGAAGAPLAKKGTYDDLHLKDSSNGAIVVPTCDAGNTAVMCAHMHWRWPAWPFPLTTPSAFRAAQTWAPGSQRVVANVVRFETFSFSSTNPLLLVSGESIASGFPLVASDVEVWVLSRSESSGRGKNLWGDGNSGWSDQLNNNEWFFQ